MSQLKNQKKSTSTIITSLRETINSVLSDLIAESDCFALLDFPNYDNVGDSAIFLGEMEYLHRRSLLPSYIATTNNCNWGRMDKAIGSGPILLQGGGNFGDLWPWFQEFREDVLTRYPGRRVVQFPQTISYSSQENIERTARIIERHGAFTLLVRDQSSFELATKFFQCDVRLCPDMAFQIDHRNHCSTRHELLLHLRTDQEAACHYDTDRLTDHPQVIRQDWPEESSSFAMRTNVMNLPSIAYAFGGGGIDRARVEKYRARAHARFVRGVRLLEQSRCVITDRLHGHIMCTLLDIPHCVLDNSYGKTSSFMEAWKTTTDRAHIAPSIDDAIDILVERNGLSLPSSKRSRVSG